MIAFGKLCAAFLLIAAAQPPAADPAVDSWPKTAQLNGATYTLSAPQLDSWDYYNYASHADVSVLAAGAKEPVSGVVWISANSLVDRQRRSVELVGLKVPKVSFPSAPASAVQYEKDLQALLAGKTATLPLARLEADLAGSGADKKARTVPVRNEPPAFLFAQSPTVLVLVDGNPLWTKVAGTPYQRILNTRALILGDPRGNLLVHVLDGFVQAAALSGPWTVPMVQSSAAEKIAQSLEKAGLVDLMKGEPDPQTKKFPTLAQSAPGIVVSTEPAELIVAQGAANWLPIPGTQLLYVQNTAGNVFTDMANQKTYLLVTGRWFRATALAGPWTYVPGKDLPADFARIPDDSPKEHVKASIPGTAQAAAAVIANEIPQTAVVSRKVTFAPQMNGPAELKPIPGTSLSYVVNSPSPILEVTPKEWLACSRGVWFSAASAAGPWAVATSVPAAVYAIPPDSPLYNLTFVKIFASTPTDVVIGTAPGYTGTVVTSEGVVVYGAGYEFAPYITSTVWYPAPVTYGSGANPPPRPAGDRRSAPTGGGAFGGFRGRP